ncbi:hypothetical protein Fmac_028159 [Flemingia macrophylla]|uniref:6-phosphogluconate dehydrogenase NADP-binding domain-containing protein n=1 Tax=Flemingia macrophylla TaxID=520843 RepID=A0ABD1LLG6_9FABA
MPSDSRLCKTHIGINVNLNMLSVDTYSKKREFSFVEISTYCSYALFGLYSLFSHTPPPPSPITSSLHPALPYPSSPPFTRPSLALPPSTQSRSSHLPPPRRARAFYPRPIAHLSASPNAVAAPSDIVFSIVGFPSDVRSVLLDLASGAFPTLAPDEVLVDMITSEPSLVVEVAAAAATKGCHSVDAPVSGGDLGTKNGTLTIFANDEELTVENLKPLFSLLRKVKYMAGYSSSLPRSHSHSSFFVNELEFEDIQVLVLVKLLQLVVKEQQTKCFLPFISS